MAARAVGRLMLVGQTLGHYRIVDKIGAGGMGDVYRAHDEHLDREVAIKVLPPGSLDKESSRKRFRKEALALSKLNHPNIATVHDFDTQRETDFLVMEYIPGVTLTDKLAIGALPERAVLQLGMQLAEGLSAAHERGIIHRDLKPGNLRLTGDGRLKILDFGLAKLRLPVTSTAITESLSQTDAMAGTLPYMAPEQLLGENIDTRTDIHAAGCVLYEMATGKRPFADVERSQLIAAILRREPLPPTNVNPRLSRELGSIVEKCLAKDPENRYQSAKELFIDLKRLSEGEILQDHEVYRPRTRLLKRFAFISGITIVILTVLISVFPSVRQRVKRWWGLQSVPSEKIIAVLPFTVVGADTQVTSFTDGLTETVTAKLTELTAAPGLQVVPAPEIQRKHVKTANDARGEFGVGMVLEGTLNRSRGQVRINIVLVDTRTRRQVRATSLTVAASDPFAVQDRVVNAAVEMLELDIPPGEREVLEIHGTQVASAYDYYLQGRGYLQNYDKVENVENAIKVFDRALQLDPGYALAYAGRGDAYWQMYESTKNPRWVEDSRGDCDKALDLNSRLPAAHVCLGTIYKGTGHYLEATAEFERVIESEPTNDHAYMELAEAYELLDKPAEAEATYRRAIKLRPHYWATYNWLGVFYYRRARYQDAVEMFEQVVALAPDNARGLFNLATAYVAQGRYADAVTVLKRSIAIRPTATAFTDLGNAYFYLRRFDAATEAYEQAVKLNDADILLWWNLGDGYYWTPGRRAQAADAYQHAVSLAKTKLSINPKDAYTLGITAVCYAMLGDKNRALVSLQEGLRLAPADPELLFKAALVYNQFGDTSQVLTWLEKAISAGFSRSTVWDTRNFDHLREDLRFQKLLWAK